MGNTVPNFSIDLTGQVALVTGASSGLGYRFAKVLAKCGAKVAISARRVEKLDALAEENKNDGGECAVVPLIWLIEKASELQFNRLNLSWEPSIP